MVTEGIFFMFATASIPALRPTQASCLMGTGGSLRVKRPGREADHTPPLPQYVFMAYLVKHRNKAKGQSQRQVLFHVQNIRGCGMDLCIYFQMKTQTWIASRFFGIRTCGLPNIITNYLLFKTGNDTVWVLVVCYGSECSSTDFRKLFLYMQQD
jgi:hypothetical protein